MNKKLIEKYKLNEAVKRFNQLNEYTFITSPTLSEDGEDDDNEGMQQPQNTGQNAAPNGQPPMGMNNNPDNGMQPNAPQGDAGNQMMTNPDNSMQPTVPMQGDQESGMDMGNGDAMPPMDGGDPGMPDNGAEDDEFNVETEEMEPSDEVIDVDELTTSQEATEYKLDDTNEKLTTLLKAVNKFMTAIEQNDQKIEDLKTEFEKRNPTPEEKLNIRSQSSYPYSETPRSYWDKKREENPHYDVIYDNDVPANKEQQKFEIKKRDLDHINYNEIAKSLDEPLKLSNFINF